MSTLSAEARDKTDEKQHASEMIKFYAAEESETLKKSETNESTDIKSPQSKKRRLSSDHEESSKKAKFSEMIKFYAAEESETLKKSETNESTDIKSPQSKKCRLSSDHEESPKKAKYAINKDVTSPGSSISSDLTTSGNNEEEDNTSDASRSIDNTALVAEHYNALEEKGLSYRNQSRIVYMRNFNNWIKSMLISDYANKVRKGFSTSLKVMDMCCGKGGDLFKWKKIHISHLICTDIAQVSLEQCQQRYTDMMNKKGFKERSFTAEFIPADCTKVRLREKFKDPSIQLDFVSCQFAFHYSFESLPQAECMLRNAAECLKTGGYFIGTIPDAYDLVSRWQKCDGNKFGNNIYSVDFQCDKTNPPLFGAKYDFHLEGVVDCPEFLVYLPILCKLALKYGLELVEFERFDKYYERFKEEGRSLLVNMEALETYLPDNKSRLLGDREQDYQHAVQYIQNSSTDQHKIGTLSQSEWEVTSLYAVFAFQKMKTIWDKEGKPEYIKLEDSKKAKESQSM
nr:PREDICTED: mRNA cap guanine-N7 methyltransferase [Linepithema humile]